MDTFRVEPKRATIMNADVVGYSRMMAENALGTVTSLLACVSLICVLVRQYGGRVIDAVGDNLSAEFDTESTALRCALQVQRALAARNRGRDGGLHIRIGLHTGELLCADSRRFGDVVNIAARLQSAADVDGILVSEAVAERVDTVLARALTDAGPKQFKNIPYAMATFGIRAPH